MCSCIENMPKVTRSDCSQVDMETEYFLSLDASGQLSVSTNDLQFRLRSCRGTAYDEVTGEPVNENNDLASYVHRLHLDGKLDLATQDAIFDILVGHDKPNDNNNQQACADAWLEATGTTYPSP